MIDKQNRLNQAFHSCYILTIRLTRRYSRLALLSMLNIVFHKVVPPVILFFYGC